MRRSGEYKGPNDKWYFDGLKSKTAKKQRKKKGLIFLAISLGLIAVFIGWTIYASNSGKSELMMLGTILLMPILVFLVLTCAFLIPRRAYRRFGYRY